MTKEEQLELKHLKERVERIMKEIFGNGGEGIKTEMVKLRQALKIATWMVTILAGIFSAVVIGEWLSYSGDQLRIMELLRKIAER